MIFPLEKVNTFMCLAIKGNVLASEKSSPKSRSFTTPTMVNNLPILISPWLEAFVAGDWLSFRSHELAAFRFLRNVRLHPKLLKAALRFWDLDVHVLRFGDNELCPTVEEFQAYLQGFASSVIVVPPYRKSMPKLLKSYLNISGGAAKSLLSSSQINVMRLMEWYGPKGNTKDTAVQARRQFALAISVLAAYMLVSPDGRVNPSLVSVAAQMGTRRNVVPLVLLETLIGLDLVYTGQRNTFSSSPLLL